MDATTVLRRSLSPGLHPFPLRSPMNAAPDNTDLARQLADVPLFKGVPRDVLLRIVALAHQRRLAAGECFFNEGDAADAFYVLTGGRLKLTQVTEEGQQVVLRLLGPGEAFGG